jgi:SH3-like domain-containing protein
MKIYLLAIAIAVLAAMPARAEDDSARLPRFVSLKAAEVFMREGPSMEHRIKWIYHRKGLPVEVVAAFDVWRRVRDMDGEVGWVHRTMLSSQRTAMVIGQGDIVLQAEPGVSAEVAKVQPGAIGQLEKCQANTCQLKFGDIKGWLPRARLWGIYAGEKF